MAQYLSHIVLLPANFLQNVVPGIELSFEGEIGIGLGVLDGRELIFNAVDSLHLPVLLEV